MEYPDTGPAEGNAPAAEETREQLIARAKAEGHSWARCAGTLPDDDLTQEWLAVMRENRRREEEGDVMQIPVWIEPLSANRFRATGGAPLPFSAEGATRDEALAHLSRLVRESLMSGAELVTLSVPAEDPLTHFAGSLRDNSLFDDWVEAMREFREKRNTEIYPWE